MEYRMAAAADIGKMLESRLDTLRAVNNLDDTYEFSETFRETSRRYFLEGDQDTVLALEGEKVMGCATLCYIRMMPTFSHPPDERIHGPGPAPGGDRPDHGPYAH